MAAIDLKSIPEALEYVEGFSRVDWNRVARVEEIGCEPRSDHPKCR
jgi:hypothetical protein